MYVLDTDTLACFLKGQGRVGERLLAIAPSQVAVPAVACAEIEWGISRAAEPALRRAQWHEFLAAVKVLSFGNEEAQCAAAVQSALQKAGAPLAPLDTLVAAIALAHDAVLVTRHTRGFSRVRGLRVEDWY